MPPGRDLLPRLNQKRAHETVIDESARNASNNGGKDVYPPLIASRSREGNRAVSDQVAKEPRSKISGGIDSVHRQRSTDSHDDRHRQADEQRRHVAARSPVLRESIKARIDSRRSMVRTASTKNATPPVTFAKSCGVTPTMPGLG